MVIIFLTACGMADVKSPGNIKVESTEKPNIVFTEKSIKDNVIFEGENVGKLKESDIINKLVMRSQEINTDTIEAKLDDETWEIVQKERSGKRVNIQKTVESLVNADPGEKRKIIVERVRPKITAAKLDRNIVIIGRYTTKILDRRDSRLRNIHLAAERLDYEKIQPGEEFSFNGVLGKRTVRKGYEKAPIIIKTENGPKKKYGVGGGICQLSSTLYNAAYKANMNITERHPHSKAVGYVAKGKDAMVAYGSSDLRFINNRKYPIMIRVYISGNRLTVKIYENRNK